VKASATNGEVRLEVPAGSRFDLDAESRHGELSAEVPGLTTSPAGGEPGRGHRATGQLAGGGVAVHLRADGDIALTATTAGPIADRPVAKPSATAPPPEAPAPVASPSVAATPKPRAVAAEAAPKPPEPPQKPEPPEEP
jgi:hypothetical protein